MKSAILPRLYPAAAARAELEAETGAPETPLDAAQSLFSGLIEQTINVFAPMASANAPSATHC